MAGSIKRVPTGVMNMDALIEGGFEKNSTNLIVGAAGSGKSIFSVQFMVEGMKAGEKCLYVTFEEKRDEFFANMEEFGWKLEEYEKKGLFIFLEYTPEKVKLMLEEGGGAIENIIVKNKVTRLVLDSITSFEFLFEKELEKREAALALFSMIRKWNCTALLTYEGDPLKGEGIDHKSLEFEADSIILIYYIRKSGARESYIEVLKMRGTKHSKNVYPLIIDKKGMKIGKKPYKKDILQKE
jgi:circadian clock protein KaiC